MIVSILRKNFSTLTRFTITCTCKFALYMNFNYYYYYNVRFCQTENAIGACLFLQVTLGMFGHEERVVYEPLTPGAIEVNILC